MLKVTAVPSTTPFQSKSPMMLAPSITIVIIFIFRKEEERSKYNEVHGERKSCINKIMKKE
jgi:hypothetical protein